MSMNMTQPLSIMDSFNEGLFHYKSTLKIIQKDESSNELYSLQGSSDELRSTIQEIASGYFKVKKARDVEGNLQVRLYIAKSPSQCLSRRKLERNHTLKCCKEVHRNVTSKNEGIANLESFLTDYSKGDLYGALNHFVHTTTGMSCHSFRVEEVDEKGASGDPVYQVADARTGEKLLILKVFSKHSNNVFQEIYSLDVLTQAKIQGFVSPRIYAIGRCHVGESLHFMLSESVAPGISLLGHFRKLSSQISSAQNRKEYFTDFLKVIERAGYTLAALHSYRQGVETQLPKNFIERVRGYLAKVEEKLQTRPNPDIDVDRLKSYFEDSVRWMESNSRKTSIIHGDTKFQNVFYDNSRNIITWIDPSKLADSLSKDEKPIGSPAKDINSFIAEFQFWRMEFFLDNQKVCMKEILTMQEVQQLREVFISGYKAGGGIIDYQEELSFYSFAGILYYLANDRTHDDGYVVREPETSRKRFHIAMLTNDLICRLNQTERAHL